MTVATLLKNDNIARETTDPRIVTFRLRDRNGTPKSLELPGLGTVEQLSMLLNPESFDTSMTQKINPIKTIGGYVIQHWGHELDMISASGYSPGFYLTDEELSQIANTNGSDGFGGHFINEQIVNKNRLYSQGYRHFKKLIDIYRHNGVDVDNTTGEIQKLGFGFVEMQYQQTFYIGHFETFNIEESADNPFSIKYDFTFMVVKEISLYYIRNSIRDNNLINPESQFIRQGL